MKNVFTISIIKRPILFGCFVFVIVALLTQYVTYQRYLISAETERDEVLSEIHSVKDRLKTSLSYNLSAAKTLAFIVENYGVPKDFNSIAKEILNSNKNIDALILIKKGVITHAYPLKSNENVIGFDILSDSSRSKEAYKAIEKRDLFFAGPYELKQGGVAVVGRLPIFIDNNFWGFSTVVIKLSTLLKASGIDTLQNNHFIYQLSKINPNTQKEEFFLPSTTKLDKEQSASIEVPDGEWKLYVMPKNKNRFFNIIIFSITGFCFSIICGIFAWYLANQPEKLNRLVNEKTLQILAGEKRFRALIEKSSEAIVLLDTTGKVIYQSPSTQNISGYSLQEIQALNGIDLIHPDDQKEDFDTFTKLVQSPGITLQRNHRFKHKNGQYIWLEGSYTNLLDNENVKAIVFNYHDITLRKKSEQKANNAKRLYEVISKINQVMVHATNEQILFKEACQIAVDLGKFKMAWIGIIDETQRKVIPVMHAGEEQNYLSHMQSSTLDDPDFRNGPTGKAISSGTYVLCNDIENDIMMKPWITEALTRGYRSSIALPINKFGKVVGTFNLYASESNYFDEKEIILLKETTDDISFSLENFEKEKMRKLAEEQIIAEKILSESIINSLPGILYLYDQTGKFIRWNKNFEIVSGYSAEEIKNMHPLDFFHVDENQLVQTAIADVFHSGVADITVPFYTKNNKKIPYYFNGRKINLNGTDYLIGMGIDITERVNAEKELQERNKQIQNLSAHIQNIREEERTRIAREIHDELGQQLTGLKMDASWIGKKIEMEDQTLQKKISGMISLIDDTIITVRRIASELRPSILDDLGLIPALEWQSQEFEKRNGIKLYFKNTTIDFNPERELSTTIFRVYQEALTNIIRYAKATEVETIIEEKNKNITLTIKDNGVGFDMNEVKNKNSLGLIGMKERALLFKGDLIVESQKLKGTTITLKIPFLIKDKILA